MSIEKMRKARKTPKVKPKFAFLVDGECESWYLSMMKRNEPDLPIDLKPEIPSKKQVCEQYKKVVELVEQGYDKVFWIIDLDVIIRESRIKKKGEKTPLQSLKEYADDLKKHKKVVLIYNNPCLEYWLLLHFEPTSKFYPNCDDAGKQLKKHLTDYKKSKDYFTKDGQDIYLKLKPHLPTAIESAKKLKSFDFNAPYAGISEMHLLFQDKEIVKAITKKN